MKLQVYIHPPVLQVAYIIAGNVIFLCLILGDNQRYIYQAFYMLPEIEFKFFAGLRVLQPDSLCVAGCFCPFKLFLLFFDFGFCLCLSRRNLIGYCLSCGFGGSFIRCLVLLICDEIVLDCRVS